MTFLGFTPDIYALLLTGALGITRLYAFISFAVFMGPSLTMPVKLPICLALYLPLHPLVYYQIDHTSLDLWLSSTIDSTAGLLEQKGLTGTPPLLSLLIDKGFNFYTLLIYCLILLKEALVGFVLAFVSSMIFYALMSAGILIDNQRGASAAQTSEYLSQESSTPTGTVLLLVSTTLLFSSGGFMALLALIYLSYVAWPVVEPIPFIYSSQFMTFSGTLVNELASLMLLVAAPFVMVSLLCDIALGVMNRFAPQLNVYILSMPIKSAVASFLLIIYISPLNQHILNLFMTLRQTLVALMR